MLKQWMPDSGYEPHVYSHYNYHCRASYGTTGQVIIAGLLGVGKKTLINSVWGWEAISANDEMIRNFGLFTLIDLPLDSYDASTVLYRADSADLIVYVLGAQNGLTTDDFNWIARFRSLNVTLMIVFNHSPEFSQANLEKATRLLTERLARPILTLPATEERIVRERFVPAMVKACPHLSAQLANEIPTLRTDAARQVVLRGIISSMAMHSDSDVSTDLMTLVDVQTRMLHEIAAIYGYKGRERGREPLALTWMLRWALRHGIKQGEQLQPIQSWMRFGLLGATLTLIVGQLAILGYGDHLPRWLTRLVPILDTKQPDVVESEPA
ncbi:MAG: hypothetical protein D6737_04990 [Chloroflexi bacterium]|nr:MAG: hypothetical protein CUN54_06625 [Phototrophicales bacterium]RMF81430.1 MAG: hypothetical protein D6737_04990 [Chloroflexota bacterium]